MIKTFKETLASLQDKQYGSTIIGLDFSKALWYWTKYFLLVSVVTVILAICALTYFVPQLPHLLRQNLPDASFTVKNGHFSTTLKEPAVLGPTDVPVIIDTKATDSAALAQKPSGILILSDKIIFKQDANTVQTQSLSDFPDFYLEKSTVISWLSQHQVQLWLIVLAATLILSVLLSAFFWAGRMLGFAFWSLGFWLLAKIIKRRISYPQAFKLVLYGSVLPYLMSAFLVLAPNAFLSLLSLGVFVYFTVSWLVNLRPKTK